MDILILVIALFTLSTMLEMALDIIDRIKRIRRLKRRNEVLRAKIEERKSILVKVKGKAYKPAK